MSHTIPLRVPIKGFEVNLRAAALLISPHAAADAALGVTRCERWELASGCGAFGCARELQAEQKKKKHIHNHAVSILEFSLVCVCTVNCSAHVVLIASWIPAAVKSNHLRIVFHAHGLRRLAVAVMVG